MFTQTYIWFACVHMMTKTCVGKHFAACNYSDLSVKKARIMLVENLVLYTVINHNTGIWVHMLSMMTYQMLIGEVLHKGSVKVRWTFSLGREVV